MTIAISTTIGNRVTETDLGGHDSRPTIESLRESIRSAEAARDELQAIRQRVVILCDLQDQQAAATESLQAAAVAHEQLVNELSDGARQLVSAMRRSEELLNDAAHRTLNERVEGVHRFIRDHAQRAQALLEAEKQRSTELEARIAELQQELAARQLDLVTERSQYQELLVEHQTLRQAVDRIPPKTAAKLRKLDVVLPD